MALMVLGIGTDMGGADIVGLVFPTCSLHQVRCSLHVDSTKLQGSFSMRSYGVVQALTASPVKGGVQYGWGLMAL